MNVSYHYFYKLPEVLVIDFIGLFIESFLFIYLISNFFKTKSGRKIPVYVQICLSLITAVILALLGYYTDNNFYAYIFTLLLIPFLYSVVFYDGKLYLKLLVCIVFELMLILLDNVFIILILHYSVNGYINYNLFISLFLIRRIFFKIVLYFIARLLLKNIITTSRSINFYYSLSLYLVCIVEFLLVTKMNLYSISYNMALGLVFLCISVPLFTYYNIHLLLATNEENKIYIMQNYQLKLQKQYLEQFIDLTDSLKKFRHDYKAYLFCMDTFLANGDYNSLHQYLQKLHEIQYDTLSFTDYTSNKSINAVLNQKQISARAANIDFSVDIVYPENCTVKDMDLIALLTNLCDNAIEASTGLADASIHIIIKQFKAYLLIEVQNTVSFNVLESNPTLKTTKSDCHLHGIGNKIIKSITESYHGFYQVDCSNKVFSAKIMLLNSKEEENKTVSKLNETANLLS